MNVYDQESRELMYALVKELKTKDAVAAALGVSKQSFNYWFNQAEKVSAEQSLKMRNLLEKIQYDITKTKIQLLILAFESPEKNKLVIEDLEDIFSYNPVLTISQRVKLALIGEELLGKRQGSRSDIKSQLAKYDDNADQLCICKNEVSPHLLKNKKNGLYRGRTSAIVAELCGFTSNTSYLQAKRVVQSKNAALIKSMDDYSVSIYYASLKVLSERGFEKSIFKKTLEYKWMVLINLSRCLSKSNKMAKFILATMIIILDNILTHDIILNGHCFENINAAQKPP